MQRALTITAWLLVAACGWMIGRLAIPAPGLHAEYFDNLTRSGAPVSARIDLSPSTEALNAERSWLPAEYSVRWSGFLVIDNAGTYEFSTISDDGSELEVDGQTIVNNDGPHGAKEVRGSIPLAGGLHSIVVRYEQLGGSFALSVNYALQGEALRAIPASALLPTAMPFGEYRLRHGVPFAASILVVLLCIAVTRARSDRVRSPRTLSIDRPIVAIAILIAAGATVRIIMMFGSNAILWGDSDVFIETFGAIRDGRYLEHDPFRTLLYPYFLTSFLAWSTEPPMDQVIVGAQHLLGIASTVCFYLAGRRAFGSRIAFIGALLLSLHTTQLFYELSILSEAFFTFVLAASLVPMVAFVERPSVRGAMLTGACCALLTLTRPVAQWLVLLPLGCVMWVLPHWKARVTIAAAIVLVFGAIMLPWAAVNQRQFGFFGVALGRGFGLFIRVFDMDRFEPQLQTDYPQVQTVLNRGLVMPSPATYVRDALGDHRAYSVPQKDELMYRFAMEAVKKQPVRFAIGSLRQWFIQIGGPIGDEAICAGPEGHYLCSRRTVGYAREPFLNRPRSEHEPVRRWVVGYFRHFQLPIRGISVLAIFGCLAYAAERRDRIAGIFLALVMAYLTFLPAFAQAPQDRYRLPIDALLFMFAAFGLSRLWSRLRPLSPSGE